MSKFIFLLTALPASIIYILAVHMGAAVFSRFLMITERLYAKKIKRMEWNWISFFNLLFCAILLAPNILFAVKYKQELPAGNLLFEIVEQIGRYVSIIFLILPIGIWKFDFSSKIFFFLYLLGNIALLIAYLIIWKVWFTGKKSKKLVFFLLSAIPTGIFLFCGITLEHWLLILSAIIFGIGHIGNTIIKTKKI